MKLFVDDDYLNEGLEIEDTDNGMKKVSVSFDLDILDEDAFTEEAIRSLFETKIAGIDGVMLSSSVDVFSYDN